MIAYSYLTMKTIGVLIFKAWLISLVDLYVLKLIHKPFSG